MKAPSEFIPETILQSGSEPFKIYSRNGWGRGYWHVVRKSDRKVMTAGTVKECLYWVKRFGQDNLS